MFEKLFHIHQVCCCTAVFVINVFKETKCFYVGVFWQPTLFYPFSVQGLMLLQAYNKNPSRTTELFGTIVFFSLTEMPIQVWHDIFGSKRSLKISHMYSATLWDSLKHHFIHGEVLLNQNSHFITKLVRQFTETSPKTLGRQHTYTGWFCYCSQESSHLIINQIAGRSKVS